MSVDGLEEPFTLLSVPRPFGSANARSHGCAVIDSLSSRSRAEVVVAVDGEGVYVYGTTTPRLVASYAVSPQTRFLSKPASVVHRRPDKSVQRITYATIELKDTSIRSVVCFSEEPRDRNTIAAIQPAWTKSEHTLHNSVSPVIGVFTVAAVSAIDLTSVPLEALVVHADGDIERFTGDLSRSIHRVEWHTRAADAVLTHASVVDLSALRSAFPWKFPRAPALPRHHTAGRASDCALVMIRRTKHKKGVLRWTLYAASLSYQHATQRSRHALHIQRLTRLDVGTASVDLEAQLNAKFSLSPDYRHVFGQFAGDLLAWHVSVPGSGAKLLQRGGVVCALPLSSSEVLITGDIKLAVADTHWQTIRGELQLSSLLDHQSPGSKRPRSDLVGTLENLDLLCVDKKTNLIIALGPESLVGVRYVCAPKGSKRRKLESSLLADNLGRTSLNHSELAGTTTRRSPGADEDFETSTSALISAGQIDDLEEFLAKELDLSYERLEALATRGTTSPGSVRWTFPDDTAVLIRKTDTRRAQSVLRSLISTDSDGVKIKMYASNVFRWLGVVGLLGSNGQSRESKARMDDTFGALVPAFVHLDPTLAVLEEVLSVATHVSCRGTIKALQVVIDSLDNINPAAETLALPAPHTNGSGLMEEDDDMASLADASRAAEDDLAFAIDSLDNGTRIRSGLLRSIFERVATFPSSHLTSTLAAELSPRQIIFLVNILRVELADGGWTTRHIDDSLWDQETDGEEGPSDRSIRVISHMLNAAIDAIGSTGWNVSLSSSKQLNTDEMVLVLRAEINAVLEGTLGYIAVGDALQEFVKYCALAEPQSAKKRRQPHALHNPGFVNDEREDSMLPMGSRSSRVAETRVSKGGRVNAKSKGAVGQEISMRVGKYSIDRIRV